LIVEAHRLRRDYGARRALDGVSFSLDAGQARAVHGPNGAGKTTLLRLLTLAMRPRSGTLTLFGHDARKQASKIRPHIGLLSHQTLLYDELSAHENLRFFGTLYGATDLDTRIPQLLDIVGLGLRADDPVAEFSRGMQQRLAIARALVHRPRLLLLDEPFSGLDLAAIKTMTDLLRNYVAQGGTMILVSHDLNHGQALCDRFLLLRRGRLECEGLNDEAQQIELRKRLLVGAPE